MPDISKKTNSQIKKLFDKYTYDYEFNRKNLEDLLNIKKSRASEIIAILVDKSLIEQSNPMKYKFKK